MLMGKRYLKRLVAVSVILGITVGVVASPAAAGVVVQHEPIMQSDACGYPAGQVGDATLRRTNGGLHIQVQSQAPLIPHPADPDCRADFDGEIDEIFTFWIVVIHNPDACTGPAGACTEADVVMNPDVMVTVTRAAGHLIGASGELNAGGHIGVGQTPKPADLFELFGIPKENKTLTADAVMSSEVHAVIEPHGAGDPSKLPFEIKYPSGIALQAAIFPVP